MTIPNSLSAQPCPTCAARSSAADCSIGKCLDRLCRGHARLRRRDGEGRAHRALLVASPAQQGTPRRRGTPGCPPSSHACGSRRARVQGGRICDGVFSVARQRRCRDQRIPAPAWQRAEQQLAHRRAVKRHARPRLEFQAERPRSFHAIEIDNGVAGDHSEIAGLADLGRQRFEHGVPRRKAHRRAHGIHGETEEPRDRVHRGACAARAAAGPLHRAGARCGASWASARRAVPPVPTRQEARPEATASSTANTLSATAWRFRRRQRHDVERRPPRLMDRLPPAASIWGLVP